MSTGNCYYTHRFLCHLPYQQFVTFTHLCCKLYGKLELCTPVCRCTIFAICIYIYQTHVRNVFDSMYQVLVSWYLVLPVLIFTQIQNSWPFESSHEHDQSLSLSMTDGCSIVISRIKTTSLAMSYIYSFCKPQYSTLTLSPWERKWTVVLMH